MKKNRIYLSLRASSSSIRITRRTFALSISVTDTVFSSTDTRLSSPAPAKSFAALGCLIIAFRHVQGSLVPSQRLAV
ncbi:hypothetical protein V2J09_006970 [Rumex salicifolius]